jgi:alkylation response protein AidB-like acyl-CoA dehydrogenase
VNRPPEDLEAFIEANAPKPLYGTATSPFQGHWGGRKAKFESAAHRAWFQACLAVGMTAPTWPRAYAGAGLSREQGRRWFELLAQRRVPLPLVGFGLTMIGPIILQYGDESQKQEHLTAIARGQIRWCQGYSEPESGSDLASLTCKAEANDGGWRITGQKIWTSHAERADWIFCLVRTSTEGRKHAGITFVVFDMALPGITVRPIPLISGASPFCETFFDAVQIPGDGVIGDVGGGWKVAMSLLGHEREMVGEAVASGGSRPPALANYQVANHAVRVIGLDESGRLRDPLIRDRVARAEMDEAALHWTIRRVREAGTPGAESSIIKLAGTELNMRRWELALAIEGPGGLGWSGGEFSEEQCALSRQYLRSRGNSIEGGTSEIQRNILATRVLGLPRGGKRS